MPLSEPIRNLPGLDQMNEFTFKIKKPAVRDFDLLELVSTPAELRRMHRQGRSPPAVVLGLDEGLGAKPIMPVDDIERPVHVVLHLSEVPDEAVAHLIDFVPIVLHQ